MQAHNSIQMCLLTSMSVIFHLSSLLFAPQVDGSMLKRSLFASSGCMAEKRSSRMPLNWVLKSRSTTLHRTFGDLAVPLLMSCPPLSCSSWAAASFWWTNAPIRFFLISPSVASTSSCPPLISSLCFFFLWSPLEEELAPADAAACAWRHHPWLPLRSPAFSFVSSNF